MRRDDRWKLRLAREYEDFRKSHSDCVALLGEQAPITILQAQLSRFHACCSSRLWVGDKTAREAWNTCRYGLWMLTLLRRMFNSTIGLGDRPMPILGYLLAYNSSGRGFTAAADIRRALPFEAMREISALSLPRTLAALRDAEKRFSIDPDVQRQYDTYVRYAGNVLTR